MSALLLLGVVTSATALAPMLPANTVANGGFEAGLAGWTLRGLECDTVSLASPGAAGSGQAVLARDVERGCAVVQVLPEVAQEVLVLDFWADVRAEPGDDHAQGIGLYSTENPFLSGAATATGFLILFTDKVEMRAFNSPSVTANLATGGWHHYQLLLLRVPGVGLLLVDGVPVTLAVGDGSGIPPARSIFFGDAVGSYSPGTSGPDVAWDEIYLGPELPV